MQRNGAAAVAVLTAVIAVAACSSGVAARGPARSSPRTVPPGSMPSSASALGAFVLGGTSLAAGAYQRGASQRGQPMQPTPGIVEFTTPSGNISCGMTGSARQVSLACDVIQHAYPLPPRPASCHLNWGSGWLSIGAGRVAQGMCLGGPPFDPVSSVLPYGSRLRHGSLACRSESAFLACADVRTGHGFAVNRTTLKTY